tara:strand:- start:1 stop:249 length:249 start_codon:yes stop_codon:yes gene_type:complete
MTSMPNAGKIIPKMDERRGVAPFAASSPTATPPWDPPEAGRARPGFDRPEGRPIISFHWRLRFERRPRQVDVRFLPVPWNKR